MFAPQEMPARFAELFPFALAGRPGQVRSVGQDAALLIPGLTRNAMNYWSCRVPVRIFGGDQDRVVNNALHGRLAARILPGGAFESLPGLGHMAHHFAQAPIVRAAEALAQAT
jgi:pimeloyl-ACP methyl ester carboxylesterase